MYITSYLWHDVLRRPYKLIKTVDSGSGRIVLLIHGIGASGNTWQPLVQKVDKSQWHIVGFDLLGFGVSPKPQNRRYDVDEHARSVIASLSRKEKKQKLTIIGHSMGCLIATHIATIRPDLLFKYSKLMTRIAEGRALSIESSQWLPFERSLQNTIMKQQAYNELKQVKIPTDIIYGTFDLMVTRTEVKKMLRANKYITFHLVNEVHDITNRTAKFIIKLLKQL